MYKAVCCEQTVHYFISMQVHTLLHKYARTYMYVYIFKLFLYCGVEDVEYSAHLCHNGAQTKRETERDQPGRQLQSKILRNKYMR